MRCPDCNKFVSLEFDQEPEAELEVAEDGTVTGTVRIVRTCTDCGTELKEASFDVEVTIAELQKHVCIEKGGGRYAKSYFGAHVNFTVKCSCKDEPTFSGEFEDEIAASGMDEMT